MIGWFPGVCKYHGSTVTVVPELWPVMEFGSAATLFVMLGLNGTICVPWEWVGWYHADIGTVEEYVAVPVLGTVWVGG